MYHVVCVKPTMYHHQYCAHTVLLLYSTNLVCKTLGCCQWCKSYSSIYHPDVWQHIYLMTYTGDADASLCTCSTNRLTIATGYGSACNRCLDTWSTCQAALDQSSACNTWLYRTDLYVYSRRLCSSCSNPLPRSLAPTPMTPTPVDYIQWVLRYRK